MSDRWTALVEHALAAGLTVRCTATGESMEPAIRDGETIVVEPIAFDRLEPGMVILTCAAGRTLAHRVLRVEPARVITRGDAVAGEDPPATPADVRGRVVAVARDGADVPLPRVPAPRTFFRPAMVPMLRMALLGLASLVLILLVLFRSR